MTDEPIRKQLLPRIVMTVGVLAGCISMLYMCWSFNVVMSGKFAWGKPSALWVLLGFIPML
jgi:hypothetical protein